MIPTFSHMSIKYQINVFKMSANFCLQYIKVLNINLFCIFVVLDAKTTTFIAEKYALCFSQTSSFL